jgi:uncharacterized protein (TIGR03435 family)
MMRAAACFVLLTKGILLAQSSPVQQFEVASIKPTPPDRWNGPSGGRSGQGKYTMYNRTLKTYILRAYFIGPNQLSGGPDWLDQDRYDIDAKAGQPVDDDAVIMVMLRNLLAERCKLVLHHENRPIEAYILEVARNGPKLEKALASDSDATTNGGHGTIEARVISMERFAEVLSRQMDLPVVNRTGLGGKFNVTLKWSPESDQAPDRGPSIFTAIQQLGLRLEARKIPIDVLVIDHVERPSPN